VTAQQTGIKLNMELAGSSAQKNGCPFVPSANLEPIDFVAGQFAISDGKIKGWASPQLYHVRQPAEKLGGQPAPYVSTRRRNERDPSSLAAFAMRLQRDFDVLVKGRQHSHQLLNRNQPEIPSEQLRQVRLLHFNLPGGCRLGQLPFSNQPFELHHQGSLELVFRGIRQAEISENVARAPFVGWQLLLSAHQRSPFAL
jgi:hypothetical protein